MCLCTSMFVIETGILETLLPQFHQQLIDRNIQVAAIVCPWIMTLFSTFSLLQWSVLVVQFCLTTLNLNLNLTNDPMPVC